MVLTKQMVHKVLLFMPESSGRAWTLPHSLDPNSKSAQVKGSYWKSCAAIVESCLSRKHTEKSNHPSGFQLCWNMCAGDVCILCMCVRVCIPASFWPVLNEPVEEVLPMLGTEIVLMITQRPLSIIGEWQHLFVLYPDMTDVLFSRCEWMWRAESLSAPLLQHHRLLPLPVWPGLWAGTRHGLLPRWTCTHTHGRLLNNHLSMRTRSSVYFLCRYWWMQLLQLHVSVRMY